MGHLFQALLHRYKERKITLGKKKKRSSVHLVPKNNGTNARDGVWAVAQHQRTKLLPNWGLSQEGTNFLP